MPESAREVRVFVSSPGDVLPERGRVDAVAAKLNREYEGLAQIKTLLWERAELLQSRSHVPAADSGGSGLRYRTVHLLDHNRHGVTGGICTHVRRPTVPFGHCVRTTHRTGGIQETGRPGCLCLPQDGGPALPTADAERRRQAQAHLDALEAFWSEWLSRRRGNSRRRSRALPIPMRLIRQLRAAPAMAAKSRPLGTASGMAQGEGLAISRIGAV